MRILVLTTRYPEAGAKGDQIRLFSWLSYLGPRHDMAVLCSGNPSSADAVEAVSALARVEVVPAPAAARSASAAAALLKGRPGQVGWMMPFSAWAKAQSLSREVDAVLAITVRALRGSTRPPLIVDHVDALSLNMRRRSTGPEGLARRGAARVESALLTRWEAQVASWAAAQIAISPEDASALRGPAPVHVVPLAPPVEYFDEPHHHRRDIDVIFTGNMKYPPNRAAVKTLIADILPAVRHRSPHVRAMVVGRHASTLGRLRGVEVASDVDSVFPYLRRARIAVVPIRHGTGFSTKALEAAASGAAVVATSEVAARFEVPTVEAPDNRAFVDAICRLLEDEALRASQVRAATSAVQAHSSEVLAGQIETVIVNAVLGNDGNGSGDHRYQ
jgi:glycosyl transferase family 1